MYLHNKPCGGTHFFRQLRIRNWKTPSSFWKVLLTWYMSFFSSYTNSKKFFPLLYTVVQCTIVPFIQAKLPAFLAFLDPMSTELFHSSFKNRPDKLEHEFAEGSRGPYQPSCALTWGTKGITSPLPTRSLSLSYPLPHSSSLNRSFSKPSPRPSRVTDFGEV